MNSNTSPQHSADYQAEQTIGILLRTGVVLAAAIVLFGGIVFLVRYGGTLPNYRVFHGEPSALTHVSGIFAQLRGFHSRAIIQLGLLVLIATPVARVAFSVWAFARERDWVYVCVTLIVLGLLLFSLFGARTF
jgi:uncharacterized membrane protein